MSRRKSSSFFLCNGRIELVIKIKMIIVARRRFFFVLLLLLAELPENPPTIKVGREPLDIGDTLYANCSSPPSCPPALLKFLLNNLTVSTIGCMSEKKTFSNENNVNLCVQVARTESHLSCKPKEQTWSDLMLELPLSEFHFMSGRLKLQCIAQVYDVYREEATLDLESARHPVPARGQSNFLTKIFDLI